MEISNKSVLKSALLLTALPLLSTSVFAGELGSLTSEVKVNDYDGGYEKTEWTIGKGSYKLNDDLKVLFDVDKDFIEKTSGESLQGWDTQFGLAQSLDQLGGFDVSIYYLGRYDATWDSSDGSGDSYTAQYIVAPYFNKDMTIAGKDFSLGIELWAQVGESDGGSLQDVSGAETNFYFDGNLSENWELNLAWYNFSYYDATGDEYDYQIGTEDYLTYTLPLTAGFSFAVEGYVEAYYTPDTEVEIIYASISPELNFKKKVNDNFSWHAAVSYSIYNLEQYDGVKNTSNNEMEMTLGFTIR